jgi:hypothetical protein
VDELDSLAKRLESFGPYELAQSKGVTVNSGYFSVKDLISLTFYCQKVTVVQNLMVLTVVNPQGISHSKFFITEKEQNIRVV